MVVFLDISRLKTVEADLAQRARDLEAFSMRLVSAQEEERARVARAIHDELGQLLTAAKLEVSAIRRETGEGAERRAASAAKIIDETIESVRQIARELRPAVLDQFGLVSAIENEVALFQLRTGVECDLSIRPDEIVLDNDRATTFFRAVQELLTNIARHAHATHLEIRVRQSAAETLLELRDDGVGIAAESVYSQLSLGLMGIRERLRQVGGSVAIEGVSGRGTIVTIRIPSPRMET
jgi:signal transduction histidine kinase